MSDTENPHKSDDSNTGSDPSVGPTAAASSVSPNSIEGLFLLALQKDVPAERDTWLQDMCGDDPERLRRVTALLLAYEDAGSFLETPAAGPRPSDEISLRFLKPSTKDGCLGTIGPYDVLEVIGRGGMGLVLRAVDLKLNRVVAVKVLLPELAANPNARRRFLREAQAAAAVSHPHVVTIHAVEEAHDGGDGTAIPPYLVMECVVGQSLQQKLDNVGSLRLAEILRISRQVGEGLAAAHQQGLIHRDIKPANILLENGVERVKITDFGLARAIDDITVTRTGEVSGTPQYMSPEQASGERVDHRSDLFSLGCVMYAMCTGHSPFRGDSLAHVIKRVTQDTPRPIAEQNAEVPPWLIQIIDCLLQKNADERFQSAAGLVAILDQHLARVQQPTDSGSHSQINQQVPVGAAAAGPYSGVASAAEKPTAGNAPQPGNRKSAETVMPQWLLTSVVPWRMRLSNWLLLIGIPALCSGMLGIAALANNYPLQIASFRPFDPQALAFGSLGLAVLTLLPAAMLRVSEQKTPPSAGSLIAWFLVGGPIGIIIWLIEREHFHRRAHLQRSDDRTFDSPGPPTPQPAATERMPTAKFSEEGPPDVEAAPTFTTAAPRPQRLLRRRIIGGVVAAIAIVVNYLLLALGVVNPVGPQEGIIACVVFGGFLFLLFSDRRRVAQQDFSTSQTIRPSSGGKANALDRTHPSSEVSASAVAKPLQSKSQFVIGLLMCLAVGAALSAVILPGNVLKSMPATAQRDLFKYMVSLFGIWVLQMLGNLVFRRNKVPPKQWALLTSAVFAALILGWFWTTVLRMPTTDHANTLSPRTLLDFGLLPTMIWVLYCVYVFLELRCARPVSVAAGGGTDSASGSKRIGYGWVFGAMAVLSTIAVALFFLADRQEKRNSTFGGNSALIIHHHGEYKPAEIFIEGKQVSPSTRNDTLTSITGLKPAVYDVAIRMVGPSHKRHTLEQKVWVRADKAGQVNLWPPIEFNAADELGPADREYGGLILDIADPDLHVLLVGMGPTITGYYPAEIPAGRHKVPIGRYSVMIFDKQAGWLNDIVSRPPATYEGVLQTMDTILGTLNHSLKLYDRHTGAYTASQYVADNGQIEIKSGRFQSVVAARTLKKVAGRPNDKQDADGNLRFTDDKFYRFLWNGKAYSFSKIQAQVVNELLQRQVAGEDTVDAESLLKAIANEDDSPTTSLSAIFNNGKHPAWNEVLQVNTEDPPTVALTPLTKPPSESPQNPSPAGH